MFFNTTKYIAELYEKETGEKLHYFGNQHIDSEVDNAVDLSIFTLFIICLGFFSLATLKGIN
jgi:hypothetical protein